MVFFDQKIHLLNFDIPDTLTIAGDRVELSGPGIRLGVRCAEVFPGCLRLQFTNAAVADPRQHSDAVLPEWRGGQPVAPRREADHRAVFVVEAGRVELGAATVRLELAGFTLVTVAAGLGACGEALLLNFAIETVEGCYGFGERTKRLNKLGDSADNLTVDVVSVFRHTYARDDYNPTYVAIPFAILKSSERFLGLFFDNPGRAILDAGKVQPGEFGYQSLGGNTDL